MGTVEFFLKTKHSPNNVERRYSVLPPFQIIGHLTFLTPSLTTRLIKKLYENIVKFNSFLKNLYWWSKSQQKGLIFYTKFWIKRMVKLGMKKVKRPIITTPSLTTRFIQKIYENIVKFNSFLKNLYWWSKPQQKNWYFA